MSEWVIQAKRFPIAGALGGHLYIAILKPDGSLYKEFHGFGQDPVTGQLKTVGSESDYIRAVVNPSSPHNLYDPAHSTVTLFTAADGVMGLVSLAEKYLISVMEYINSQPFNYKMLPEDDGTQYFNSNSVFLAFLDAVVAAIPATAAQKSSAISIGGSNPGVNADILQGNTWSPNLSDETGLGYKLENDGSINRLIGGSGNDILVGKNGNDVLIGGAGNDLIYGGAEEQTDTKNATDGTDVYLARALLPNGKAPTITLSVKEDSENKKTVVINDKETDTLYSVEWVFANRHTALNSVEFRNDPAGIRLKDIIPTYREQLNDQYKQLNDADHWLGSAVEVADGGYGNFYKFVGTGYVDFFELNHLLGREFDGGNGIDEVNFAGYTNGDLVINLESGIIRAAGVYASLGEIPFPDSITVKNIENAVGATSNDVLIGSEKSNVLTGGKGADVLTGLEGADVFSFAKDDGKDTVTDYRSQDGDRLRYTNGILPDSLEFSRIEGTNSVLIKTHEHQVTLENIFQGPGDTQTRFVTVEFGVGVVTYAIEPDGTATAINLIEPSAGGGSGGTSGLTLTGTSGNDVLIGSDYQDNINGGDGDDTIVAGAGNDLMLFGGNGNDFISGGDGVDQLYGNNGNDVIFGGDGDDLILVGAGDDGNNVAFGGAGNDRIGGDPFAQDGSATNGKNYFYGEAGDDTLWALGTGDYLDGGEGNDHLRDERGTNSTIVGGFGNDTISMGVGSSGLVIDGEGEDYYGIVNGAGVLVLASTDGQSDTFSASGDVTLSFAAGTQGFVLSGVTLTSEEFGTDTVSGGFSHVIGTSGDDVFTGRSTSGKTYEGGAGKDYFYNIAGFMMGGSGGDTFGYTKILDYSFAEGDILKPNSGILLSHFVGSRDGNDLHIDLIDINMSGLDILNAFVLYGFFLSNDKIIVELDDGERSILAVNSSGDLSFVANTGSDEADVLSAGSGGEHLAGYAGDDTLTGGDGNDTLDSGIGADEMAGGDGDDAYIVDNYGDIVFEVEDEGTDTVLSSISYELGDNVENLTLTGALSTEGNGNSLHNVITGNSGNNFLAGMDGSDTYVFGEGGGHDVVEDTEGTLDRILFDASVDEESVLYFRLGDDLVISYGTQDDTITARDFFTAADTIEEVEFDDSTVHDAAYINAHLELVAGSHGDDTLTGGSGNDVLAGLGGEDVLGGDEGNDTLDGGAGNDSLFGGDGDDTYVFADGSGHDVIEDSEGTLDTILFDASVSASSVIYVQSGDDLLIRYGTQGDTITVTNYFVSLDTIEEVVFADSTIHDSTYISAHLELPEGTSGNDTLSGTLGNDTLEGLAGNDLLRGFAGDDLLDGGDGADTMIGGLGNDTYIVDNTDDVVIETINEGNDTILSSVSYELSAHVENLILTGSANLNAAGNSLNNSLIGNEGNNTLNGGAGADTLVGGAGNDVYIVDHAGDVAIEEEDEGTDTVLSSVTWTLGDHFENLTLTSGANINGAGNDLGNTIIGNSGNNTLNGGAGVDTMIGGAGNDIYIVDNTDDVIVENAVEGTDAVLASASYVLSENIENLTLTGSGNINGTGNTLNNTLIGNSGNNTLDGGAGNDRMEGGAGDDVYVVDSASDVVVENTDAGIDTVMSNISYTLGANLENLTLTGSVNINGTGNAFDNTIVGNSGNNTLNGMTGADTMMGGAGNDTYIVDNAGDVVTEDADEGVDLVQSSVSFTLSANVENLTLIGTENIDAAGNFLANALMGNSGVNVLTGGGGNDLLDGSANADTMIGGTGDDTYVVDNVSDTAVENEDEGTDTIYSSVTWTLGGHFENLTLTGSSAINAIGNAYNNTLVGNTSNNTLDGGAGADAMSGGAGSDTYIVDDAGDVVIENASQGIDTVKSSLSYTLGDNVENLTLTGSSNINGTGNDLNNVIIGNSGNNTLFGNGGVDTLDGGAGADTMIGGTGNDTYIVDNTGDVVIESASEGADSVLASVSYMLSDNVERLTLTGSANINATGNALINTLVGNIGNNTLDGGAGLDRMEGGDGDDVYIVDNTSDTVIEAANEGIDLVLASVGFTLGSNVENLTLTGSSNINGIGNTLVNTITGNSGNNTLNGGAGADTLIGGLGNDVYVVDNAEDVVTEAADEGTDTVQSSITWMLGSYLENLTLTGSSAINGTGNSLDNILTGNTGVNTLDGGAGSDFLNGGTGADTLIGGTGDDTYVVDNVGDVVIEQEDEGIDTVQSSVTYTLSEHVEDLTLTGSSAIHATGNSLDNTLTGNTGANTLDGGAGADTMIGGAGNDVYIVDNAGDVVVESASQGSDTVLSSMSYGLTDNVENLTLTGSSNINGTGNDLNNVIIGNEGNNTLIGNGGIDTLDGGVGADTLIGGIGNDVYVVDDIGDVVFESAAEGTDTVQASISYILTDNVENLTLTGTDNLNGTGNALNNTIVGNSGNNTLDGGTGNDRMEGGAGDDVYIVDSSSDTVIETANNGTDLVLTSASFTLGTNVENLTLTETADINGTGNTLVNILTGNSGNNTLNGGTGADTMIGGLGDDVYVVDNVGDIVIEADGEGTDTIQSSIAWTLADYFENLTLTGSSAINGTGNALDNVIIGNSGVNVLSGGAGHDTLNGGTGADTLIGGIGNDVYIVDNVGDVVIEEEGEGTDTVESSVTHTLASNVENLTLTGTSSVTAIGNSGNNTIIGNTGANLIDGGAGADTMMGGAGNDIYVVDDVGDIVIENAAQGTDTVRAYISYTLTDNVERLDLMGSDNLNATGNSLNNTLIGNSGNNTLDGGAGNDAMQGGAGDDVYIVDSASDSVSENASEGTDLVLVSVTYTISDVDVENLTLTGTGNVNGTGNASANVLTGNSGNNVLSGMNGDDILFGGGGNDSLSGGNGNDTLYGGAGTDTLTGGANTDIFVFDLDSYGSIDIVTDFSTAQGDALDIRDLLDGYDSGTDDITEWVRISNSGSNSTVEVDRDGSGSTYGWTQIATLNGVTGLTDEAALVASNNLLVA